MKNKKIPLYIGIVLLVFGVLLRIFTSLRPWPVYIIILGALSKLYFIFGTIKRGEYKPGFEVGLLYLGVAMFLTGIYFRSHPGAIRPVYLMAPGIALKLTFILVFIRKLTRSKVRA